MHEELLCGDMNWVCIAGNCDGCYLKSVCNQPCPYIDGHLDEVIEATCNRFKNCVSELKEYMEQKGYKNLKEIRGSNHHAWMDYIR